MLILKPPQARRVLLLMCMSAITSVAWAVSTPVRIGADLWYWLLGLLVVTVIVCAWLGVAMGDPVELSDKKKRRVELACGLVAGFVTAFFAGHFFEMSLFVVGLSGVGAIGGRVLLTLFRDELFTRVKSTGGKS